MAEVRFSDVSHSPPHDRTPSTEETVERRQLPNPALLMQLALAYRSSMVLFAATELEVFTRVHHGDQTVSQLARACGVQAEPLRLLLEACVAEGMMTRDGDRYRNAPVTDAFLVRTQPTYGGHGLKYAEDLYPAWGRLAELVRTGTPVIDPESILGEDKAKTRAFILAMHERARGLSAVLPHGADFAGRRSLLDIGGGPGTYSIALVQQTPGLRSTVLDLPGVLEITREIVTENGCEDRITLRPGSYLTTDFGSGYDAVLLSGMMHRETGETCHLLLNKSFGALDSGGMVVVSDVFFDNDAKNSPPFALYFALNMMLTSRDGSAHAKTEMARWVAGAGFAHVDVRDLPPPNPHSLIVGIKP
jgi:hypothetical protein